MSRSNCCGSVVHNAWSRCSLSYFAMIIAVLSLASAYAQIILSDSPITPAELNAFQLLVTSPSNLPSIIPTLPAAFSAPYSSSGDIRLSRPPIAENSGCIPFSTNSSQGMPWFGNAMLLYLSTSDSSCSPALRVYHASLVGVKLIIVADSTFVDEMPRVVSGASFQQFKYGDSTDSTLNVTQWLLNQPAGMGYGYQSPYPEPAYFTIRASSDGYILAPLLRKNLFFYGNPGTTVLTFRVPDGMQDLDSSQKAAIYAMAKSLQFPATSVEDRINQGYGTRRSWNDFLENPYANPCALGLMGLTCQNGVVHAIILESVGLTGTIPDAIANLVNMTVLKLNGNSLTGTVPKSLCTLTSIVQIEISSQGITDFPDCWCGAPSATRLSDPTPIVNPATNQPYPLAIVRIGYSQLRRFPVSLLACANLNVLEAPSNRFDLSNSILPDVVSIRVRGLVSLDLSSSGIQFGGVIPYFRNMTALRSLKLSGNPRSFNVLRNDTFYLTSGMNNLDLSGLNLKGSPWPYLAGPFDTLSLTDCGLIGRPVFPIIVDIYYDPHLSIGSAFLSGNIMLPDDNGAYSWLSSNLNSGSHKLSRMGLRCGPYKDLSTWLDANIPRGGVKEIDLSNNELHDCPWTDAWSSYSAGSSRFSLLTALNMSGNRISMLPRSLLWRYSTVAWTSIDVSNCSLNDTMPTMPVPITTLHYFDARNNPNFRADASTTYLQQAASRPRLAESGLLCPQLLLTYDPTATILMDPAFRNFEGCSCDRGSFGVLPNCSMLPSTVAWSYNLDSGSDGALGLPSSITPSVIPSTSSTTMDSTTLLISPPISGQTMSDGFFGNSRFTPGMLTTFTISPASATPAASIFVNVLLNARIFDQYTDMVSLYEGGDDLNGHRVLAIHGSDETLKTNVQQFMALIDPTQVISSVMKFNSLPDDSEIQIEVNTFNLSDPSIATSKASLLQSLLQSVGPQSGHEYLLQIFPGVDVVHSLKVPVSAAVCTLQFNTFDSEGLHFIATYSSSASCYGGQTLSNGKCYPETRANLQVRATVFTVGGVAAFFTLLSVAAVVYWRDHMVMRAASPSILLLQCFCMFLLCAGSMLFAVIPSSAPYPDAVCHLRIWFTGVPLLGMLAVLVAKSHRVVTIFTTDSLKPKRVTEADVLKWVCVMLCAEIVLCAVFSGWRGDNVTGMSRSLVTPGTGSQSLQLVHRCSRESPFYAWLAAQLVFFGVLAIWGGVLAFRTRDVVSQFNDSVQVANALFSLISLGAVAVPVTVLVESDMNATVLLQGLACQIMVITFALTIFLPKAYYCATGRSLQATVALKGAHQQVKSNEPGAKPQGGNKNGSSPNMIDAAVVEGAAKSESRESPLQMVPLNTAVPVLDGLFSPLSQLNPLSGPDSVAHTISDDNSSPLDSSMLEGVDRARYVISQPREEYPGAIDSQPAADSMDGIPQQNSARSPPKVPQLHLPTTMNPLDAEVQNLPQTGNATAHSAGNSKQAFTASVPSSQRSATGSSTGTEFLTARSADDVRLSPASPPLAPGETPSGESPMGISNESCSQNSSPAPPLLEALPEMHSSAVKIHVDEHEL